MSHSNDGIEKSSEVTAGETPPPDDPAEFRRRLAREFQDKEYRESYAEEALKTSLASQISAIRQQRGLNQAQLAAATGTKQSSISRIENVNYSAWNVKTLLKVANALGTRLKISLETFGSLIEEAESFSRRNLERPPFEADPLIQEWAALPSTAIARMDEADNPRTWMQRAVGAWLNSTDWDEQRSQLTNWLRGYGLPALGTAEDPHSWIMYGLPLGAERPERQRRFAELLARFVNERPDMEFRFDEAEDALYNLFLLCAGMDWCELLADPLSGTLDRIRKAESDPSLRARDGLLAALIRTQVDPRHHELWREMILQGKHTLLPGNEYAGFSGVKWMPESMASLGQPNIGAIAGGLKAMADLHLAKLPTERRDREFCALVEQVLRLYNGDRSTVEAIRKAAKQLDSARWATLAFDGFLPARYSVTFPLGEVIEAEVVDKRSCEIEYVAKSGDASAREFIRRCREVSPKSGGAGPRWLKGTLNTVIAAVSPKARIVEVGR